MKRYIVATREIPTDTIVDIKSGFHKGDWGVVKHYDGEYYHVAMFGDPNDCPVFDRSELKVSKSV